MQIGPREILLGIIVISVIIIFFRTPVKTQNAETEDFSVDDVLNVIQPKEVIGIIEPETPEKMIKDVFDNARKAIFNVILFVTNRTEQGKVVFMKGKILVTDLLPDEIEQIKKISPWSVTAEQTQNNLYSITVDIEQTVEEIAKNLYQIVKSVKENLVQQ